MPKHTVHDGNTRKDASVTKKGSGPVVPTDHWQMDVGASVFARGNGHNSLETWLARPGKDRPTPHIKINECDH